MNKKPPRPPPADAEGDSLWAHVIRSVAPLRPDPRPPVNMPADASDRIDPFTPAAAPPPGWRQALKNRLSPLPAQQGGQQGDAPSVPPAARGSIPGLDRRTAERLRRGQLSIDARIDLHGLRQHEAREALTRFIRTSSASGHRCVLVITGKGRRLAGDTQETGIIRKSLPFWLSSPEISPLILHHTPAQPRDGGSGATYILLRRTRDRE